MDNDTWRLYVLLYKWFTWSLIVVVILLLLTGIFIGKVFCQDFDGICRMSCNGKQWTGVAISDHEILTVAHHEETENIRAEFPERGHGAFERIGVKATIVRANKAADLSLLYYKCPSYATIRTYKVSAGQFEDVLIRGYVGDKPMMLKTSIMPVDNSLDGYKILTLRGLAVVGMSGSPVTSDDVLVGIQFGITDTDTNAATADTIIQFLEDK